MAIRYYRLIKVSFALIFRLRIDMSDLTLCPACQGDITYPDRDHIVCASCGHEWQENEAVSEATGPVYRDANGTELKDGDTVTLIKDLKVKGSSTVIKMGTRITNIRLVEGDHDVDCKVDGQKLLLKSCFMKKA